MSGQKNGHDPNESSGGVGISDREFESAESVLEAVQAEVKHSRQGFIHEVYRNWCLEHPDLILQVDDDRIIDASRLLKLVGPVIGDVFDKFMLEHEHDGTTRKKDNAKAKELKEKGNTQYKSQHFKAAIDFYTESAKHAEAPSDSDYLALAFANRSVALFQAKHFQQCLQDVQRAHDSGYPQEMRYKLYERRVRCLLYLEGRVEEVPPALEEFMSALKKAGLAEDKERVIVADLKKTIDKATEEQMKKSGGGSGKSCTKPKVKSPNLKLPKVPSPNSKFPALSQCVTIGYDAAQGRHALATRNVSAGEILLVEDPAVSRLDVGLTGRYCTNCLQASLNPVPSPLTTEDVFCHEDCLEEAVQSFHRIEAPIQQHLQKSGLVKNDWLLAFRAITQKPLEYFLEDEEDVFATHNTKYGADDNGGIYKSKDYRSLFNLVTLDSLWDPATNLFKVFVVHFLVRCLRQAKYFRNPGQWELSEEEFKIAHLLCHFMSVATMNSHEIGHFTNAGVPSPSSPNGCSPLSQGMSSPIGCAVEPTLVLLNHSCDPVILRVNIGRATVAFAAKDIKEGQEITDCYLPLSMSSPRESRQQDLLAKYKFICQCRPCSQNWPINSQIPRSLNDVPPEQFRFSLQEGGDLAAAQRKFAQIQKLGAQINLKQKGGKHKECLDLCIEFLKVLHQTLMEPHQFFVMASRTMWSMLWILHGSATDVAAH